MNSEERGSQERQEPSRKAARKLPCGAKVCVHCHKGCGSAMAAYLSDLEWEQQPDAGGKKS